MNSIATRSCSAKQAGILNRNDWLYAKIRGNQVRIHPHPAAPTPAIPAGPPQYMAEIEIIDPPIDEPELADQEAIDVILDVFGNLL